MTLLWSRGQPRWVATFRILAALAMALAAFLIVRGVVLAAGDPAGDATIAEDPAAGVDFVWTLTSGALVFFMQAGFALLGAGLIRAKNTVNYLTKNILDFAAAGLSFWAFGYAFMFGGSGLPGMDEGNAFIGFSGFFLVRDAYDVSTTGFWFFQMVFAATTATIVAGAVAERTKVTAYLAYGSSSRRWSTPSTVTGCGAAAGWAASSLNHGSAPRRWTSPDRAWCTPSAVPGPGWRGHRGRAAGQVRAQRRSAEHSGPQHGLRGDRHVRAVLRLVWLQRREHGGGE